MVPELPTELLEDILCRGGPLGLLPCLSRRAHVAAVRVQRRWRAGRLRDGDRVLFRYRWMPRWNEGTVGIHDDGGVCLRACRRVIFVDPEVHRGGYLRIVRLS